MEKRRLGRTGHLSTVAIFGAAAFWDVPQTEADRVLDLVERAGINHVDVAPSYGTAESRLGGWLARNRERLFVGCKTMERTREGAAAELRASLERLQIDSFDLYQIHAVTAMADLEAATGPGGALEAIVEAQRAGLTRFIGITGHGIDAARLYLEALERFDFDTVMFPLNHVQCSDAQFRREAEALLRRCRERDVGTMVIKSIARGSWGERERIYNTWYEPFDTAAEIEEAINFVLSQDVTGLCTAGDIGLLPLVLEACENYTPMAAAEQEALIARGQALTPLFVRD